MQIKHLNKKHFELSTWLEKGYVVNSCYYGLACYKVPVNTTRLFAGPELPVHVSMHLIFKVFMLVCDTCTHTVM